MNDKDDKPRHFGVEPGRKDNLYFREGSNHIKNYLNGRRSEWRAIMSWAQNQTNPIDQSAVDSSEWTDRASGNEELYEFLLKILHNEALAIAENTDSHESGLEVFSKSSWRLRGARRHVV